MNIYKKLILGLGFFLAVTSFALIKLPHHALAFYGSGSTANQDILDMAQTLKFKDGLTVTGTIAGKPIAFVRTNLTEQQYRPAAGSFCSAGTAGSITGIKLSGDPFSGSATTITGTLDVDRTAIDSNSDCQNTNPGTIPISIGSPAKALNSFEWDVDNLQGVDGSTPLTHVGTSPVYTQDSSACGGSAVIVLNNGSTTQGTLFLGINTSFGVSLPKQYFSNGNCHALIVQAVTISGVQGEPAASTASAGDPCTGGTDCDTTTGTCLKDGGDCVNSVGSEPSCEKNFSSTFSWLICGALGLADDAAVGINNFVQDQLTVCTGISSTTNQPCSGNNNLTDKVKQAWSIFRIIASAMLVIVLLVAVIAEAVGGGSRIDAYTIRKALPKLVVAVIFIQLSWVTFKWAIDLSNDLGQGIQSLLYAPFGGADNMSLDKLVGAGTDTSTNDKFAFFALIAAGGAAIANLPGLLLLALYVVIALFTAFIVLIIRKILIILFVILAPIAILAWILPGTESYWKTWKDNFIKLLAMFPLIMAMIAGGRIFAYITSSTTSGSIFRPHLAVAHVGALPIPYLANATDFATLAIIVFAFFIPYMMMPKAFSWGGKMMSSVFTSVSNRINKSVGEKGKESIKGMTERYRGTMAEKYQPNDNILKRGLFRVGSGHYNPLPGALGGRRSRALAIQAGDKSKDIKKAEADAVVNRKADKARDKSIEVREYERDNVTGALLLDKEGKAIPKVLRDAAGNVQYDAAGNPIEASKRKLDGVAAYKQSLVESSHSSDPKEREAAITRLFKTSSWPEISSSVTSEGALLVEQSPEWDKTIITGEGLYPQTQQKRYDLVPHIKSQTYTDNLMDELGYDDASTAAGKAKRDSLRGQELLPADRVVIAARDYMAPEDFASQSQGFWDTARRANDPRVEKILNDRLAEVAGTGQYGLQVLGRLRGGETEESVHKALGGTIHKDPATGEPVWTQNDGQEGSMVVKLITEAQIKSAPPAPVAAAPPTPGELRIAHEQTYNTVIPPAANVRAAEGPVTAAGDRPTNPQREAYKARIMADATFSQAQAHGMAYEVPTTANRSEQIAILGEIRNAIMHPPGGGTASPARVASFNARVDQLQQAHSERINAEATHAAATGGDPVAASRAMEAHLAPLMHEIESRLRIP